MLNLAANRLLNSNNLFAFMLYLCKILNMKRLLFIVFAGAFQTTLAFAQSAQCSYTFFPIIQEELLDPFAGPIPVQTGVRFVPMGPCTATTDSGQFLSNGQVIQIGSSNNAVCKFISGLTLPCGN